MGSYRLQQPKQPFKYAFSQEIKDKAQIGQKEATKQANSTMDPIETWEHSPIQCEEKTLEKNKIKVVDCTINLRKTLYLKQQQQRLTIIDLSMLFQPSNQTVVHYALFGVH